MGSFFVLFLLSTPVNSKGVTGPVYRSFLAWGGILPGDMSCLGSETTSNSCAVECNSTSLTLLRLVEKW